MLFTKPCATPECGNSVEVLRPITKKEYYFCKECRLGSSYKVLVVQAQHGYSLKKILLDAASLFESVSSISDYVGVSSITIYSWLDKYFNLSFQEFKRRYICKSLNCYTLDVKTILSSYARHAYLLQKIKAQSFCACSNIVEQGIITTNAPLNSVANILKEVAFLEKVSDAVFRAVPSVFRFGVKPVTFTVPSVFRFGVKPVTFYVHPLVF